MSCEDLDGAVAQLGERGLCKPEVVGSIPISSTTFLHAGTHGAACRKSRAPRGQPAHNRLVTDLESGGH